MPVETEVEHIPLSKQRLMEFLEGQKGPVTAKAASIDLDTRASTVTEMLERCAAQGLVEREASQRPREYRITDAGRQRSELLRSGQGKSAETPESAETVETPGAGSKKTRVQQLLERVRGVEKEESSDSESEREEAGAVNLVDLREEVARQFEGLREDVRDLFEALRVRPGDSAERIQRALVEQAKAAHSEALRDLYRTRYELRALGWFDSKDEVAARIAELESKLGKEAVEQIERLVSLEGQIRRDSDSETLRAVLELRDELDFPASVFGRRSKDAEAAE
jgi:DNA-binding MarR family transcriptional regulator